MELTISIVEVVNMINKNIYIKLKYNCDAITYFENSYREQSDAFFYNFNKQSTIEIDIKKAFLETKYSLIALIHNNGKIDYAYLGTGTIIRNEKGYAIKLSVKAKLKYGTAIKNICKLSELNLEKDFKKDEYVLIEESELISNQIDFIINKPFSENAHSCEYSKLDSEKELSEYAQRNENCKRQYNLREPMKNRGEFQRDYERIVHSKAFRRMVDKAQVFSASKGDYYRTRMTHTQAVSQIARGIAEGLKLNLYLTEAIA